MIRRYAGVLHVALGLADAGSAMLMFVLVSLLRFGPDWHQSWAQAGLNGTTAAILYGAGWWLALWSRGLYRLRARWQPWREVLDIVQAMVALALVSLAVLYLFKLPDVSRLFLFGLFPAQIVVTAGARLAIRLLFSRLRNHGRNLRYILMVGANEAGFGFAERIAAHPELGLIVIGYLAAPGEPAPGTRAAPILGTVEEIERVLHSQVVDEVAICLPPSGWSLVDPISQLCHDEGKIVRIPLLDLGFSVTVGRVEDFEGVPLLSVARGSDRAIGLALKSAVDAVGATVALVVLSPILAFVAVSILVRDGRPILFRQTRSGLHGRPFGVLKFRTMVTDAEDQLASLAERNEIAGHAFKLTDDPRVTRTGRWLRRTSLDELPQLINVLRGDMSLVGPRPPLPSEVDGYDVWHRRRLSMRPGITGLWQVSARREQEFDRWVELDLDYIERWSLWLDFAIMLRTLPAMLQGR
jgi:exopolysaccharide biosynthesis polyprenyl glycosylphosphotransferase